MVEPVLLGISLMWFPVGLLLLGKGEARGTGALTLMVGTLTCVGAIIIATVGANLWVGGLLFAYGLFYNMVGYALYSGLTDMRSVGNASVTVGLITIAYIFFCFFGPINSTFLGVACLGYLVLYIMVWLNAYGKLSGRTLGYSLIIWTFVGLWYPAFSLLATGALPWA